MLHCNLCGNELEWIGDYNLDEVYGEGFILPAEKCTGEGVVSIRTCKECGMDFEIVIFDTEDDIDLMQITAYESKE